MVRRGSSRRAWLVRSLIGVSLLALTFAATPSVFSEIGPDPYWWTMRDGHVSFCAQGVDTEWVEQTIEQSWGIGATPECSEPDLIVEVVPSLDPVSLGEVCAIMYLFSDPCLVQISNACLSYRSEMAPTALAHDFGHCAGFGHAETGVMTIPITTMPTENDKRLMRERYGLGPGLVPSARLGQWTLARWTGYGAPSSALGNVVAYSLENGGWLRYIAGAPDSVNSLRYVEPDQPLLVAPLGDRGER